MRSKKTKIISLKNLISLLTAGVLILLTCLPAAVFADADGYYYFGGQGGKGSGLDAHILNVTDTMGGNSVLYQGFCGDRDTPIKANVPYRTSTLEQMYGKAAANKIRTIFMNSILTLGSEEALNNHSELNLSEAEWITAAQCAIWHYANDDQFSETELAGAWPGYLWYLSWDLPQEVSTGITGFPTDFVLKADKLPYTASFSIAVGENCENLQVTFGGKLLTPAINGSAYTYTLQITEDDLLAESIPLTASWTVVDTDELMLFVPVGGKTASQTLMGLFRAGDQVKTNCVIRTETPPETPVTPDIPGTPDTPNTPTTPDGGDKPHYNPPKPSEPATPFQPQTPAEPVDPVTPLPDPEVPLVDNPGTPFPDPEVPLGDVPQTGAENSLWAFALLGISLAGFSALFATRKKNAHSR